MNKITIKMILATNGIAVIDYAWFSDKERFDRQDAKVERMEKQLGYPMIVKPTDSGSSVGITSVHNREELVEVIENAVSDSKHIIVKHLVEKLKEINCSGLGNYY